MGRQYHIQLSEGECAPNVLLPGDPRRVEAAEELGYRYHVGITRTHDGFYARRPKPGGSFNGF